MNTVRLKSQNDVKRLGHHLPINKLVPLALINDLYSEQCVERKNIKLIVLRDGDKVKVMVDGAGESWCYHPDSVFHDGPLHCSLLAIGMNCTVPPEAVRCESIVISLRPENVLFLSRTTSCLVVYSPEKQIQYEMTLHEMLGKLGPNLESLRFSPSDFTDGTNFVDEITDFQASWPNSKLKSLTLTGRTVDDLLLCLKQNMHFVCNNGFLRMITMLTTTFHELTDEEIDRIKAFMAQYFVLLQDGQTATKRVIFHYAPNNWLRFALPTAVLNNNDINENNNIQPVEEGNENQNELGGDHQIPMPPNVEEQPTKAQHFRMAQVLPKIKNMFWSVVSIPWISFFVSGILADILQSY